LGLATLPAQAQREWVLKQIDLPHPYYYREMYLPQLATGPSSVAWLPDSRGLVYSMAGSLWLQKLDSSAAEELTAGPGYDYLPDCSRDGRWVVYSKYHKDALELWVLDRKTRETHALTNEGAVNLEARFSPDGSRIVFVSTAFNKRFHIFAADFREGRLENVQRLTGETRSSLPRYYYSVFDTEISPAWSADGKEILYVSNRGHIYGSGGFWRMKADGSPSSWADAREIHYEETNWKARPEVSPDGTRIVYASYLGRAWHQLWTMPAAGGDAFPLTYGDYDNTAPRWSSDGKAIAFISNRGGNTSLWVEHIPGGDQKEVFASERRLLHPSGVLEIKVRDAAGNPTSARVSVTGEDGRAYAPNNAWMHADDNFDRATSTEETHYFHMRGAAQLRVPKGPVKVEIMKGFEHEFIHRTVQVGANATSRLSVQLKRLRLPVGSDERWVSGDVHVHMNYAGTYRNGPENLARQAEAEDLSIVENLVVNKEQRIPDMTYFPLKDPATPDKASTKDALIQHGQEFHTSYWGHLGLLNLTDHYLLPDYSAYANTSAASLWPTNADIADLAHAQHALVGYVHPFDTIPDPDKDASLTNELPVDVALGEVDYIEAMGFSDHKSTTAVWYRLLNCGFHLPTAAGTDAMANYTSLRGPVGLNRVYAQVKSGPLQIAPWLESVKQGKTFATNGPLIGFTLAGHALGETLTLPKAGDVKFSVWLRSLVPVDHWQVVCNGKVAWEYQEDSAVPHAFVHSNLSSTLELTQSGWCLARAWSDKPQHPILDAYPYATTSPIYVNVGNEPVKSKDDATYFVAWIDRLIAAAEAHSVWNNETEKRSVLDLLQRGRSVYAQQTK
jgi:Tol biopolymer transport system component